MQRAGRRKDGKPKDETTAHRKVKKNAREEEDPCDPSAATRSRTRGEGQKKLMVLLSGNVIKSIACLGGQKEASRFKLIFF